jgi:hypothetical protein
MQQLVVRGVLTDDKVRPDVVATVAVDVMHHRVVWQQMSECGFGDENMLVDAARR